MNMTNEEIVTSFIQAKHPLKQIGVLAVLNACEKSEIVEILKEAGVRLPGNYKPKGKGGEPERASAGAPERRHGTAAMLPTVTSLRKEGIGMSIFTVEERLVLIEGISDKRLYEIITAEKDGRLKIMPEPLEETCGSCIHFHRESGTAYGPCDCRKNKRTGNTLRVNQGRIRCRPDYEKREDADAEDRD